MEECRRDIGWEIVSKLIKTPASEEKGLSGPVGEEQERRQVLKTLGRFATVTAPAVAVILAADGKPNRAIAASGNTGETGPTGGGTAGGSGDL
jgi:hypothetical protein